MPSLNLNGKVFSLYELKGSVSESYSSEFEKSTLAFCKAWLNGQKEFKINTSGSTGAPKEIRLSRLAMEASALTTIKALNLKPGGTSLVCLDTKYIAGQMMLARSLMNEMNIVAIEPSSNPLNNITRPIDFAAFVPYQLEAIASNSIENLDLIRSAIIGGAAVSNALKEKIRNVKGAIYATYGMTETISHVALQKLNGVNAQDYFEAFQNIQLKLDTRGCLCIKADHLGEEIVTNDLVELISDKKFKWLGRFDNIINSGGIKIIPEKVEAALETIFDSLQINNRFFVTGLPDEKLGQRVAVIFEGIPLQDVVLEGILGQAAINLKKYELPKEFRFMTRFEEAKNGKINRIETIKILLSSYTS